MEGLFCLHGCTVLCSIGFLFFFTKIIVHLL
uniref:Uncharacterized protein n=1 Tax=Arundo donax TaxID=35708 RepID=A0A0A9GG67_ARUDO